MTLWAPNITDRQPKRLAIPYIYNCNNIYPILFTLDPMKEILFSIYTALQFLLLGFVSLFHWIHYSGIQ